MKPIRLVQAASGLILTGMLSLALHGGEPDVRTGKELFDRRCSGCHAPDFDKGGPRLRGILNRKAAAVKGFPYSDALRASDISWDEKRLNQWLENPDSLVKGNDMEFGVSNPDERAAIIAYLKSLTK